MAQTLPPDLQDFVDHELATGRYRSTEDIVIAGLRLLQRDRQEAMEGIQEGLAQQASAQLVRQYLIGDADYLDVLSSIQAQQSLQRETLSSRLDLILIRIGLYLALAGDFDTCPQGVADSPPDPTDVRADEAESHPGLERLPPPEKTAPEIEHDE